MTYALDMLLDRDGAQDETRDGKTEYLRALKLIERLHRLMLDVIKDAFEREGRNDISSVQALLLFNIGDSELTAGELRSRGYYLGSNVSYNLKKLVEGGYIHHERSDVDKRSVRIRLTEKGKEVCRIVDALYNRQMEAIEKLNMISPEEFQIMNRSLRRLEGFWADQIRFRL